MKDKKVRLGLVTLLFLFVGLPLVFVQLRLFGEDSGFMYIAVSIVLLTLTILATSYWIGKTNDLRLYFLFIIYLAVLQLANKSLTTSSFNIVFYKEDMFYLALALIGLGIGYFKTKSIHKKY